jgi:hypothetical protein
VAHTGGGEKRRQCPPSPIRAAGHHAASHKEGFQLEYQARKGRTTLPGIPHLMQDHVGRPRKPLDLPLGLSCLSLLLLQLLPQTYTLPLQLLTDSSLPVLGHVQRNMKRTDTHAREVEGGGRSVQRTSSHITTAVTGKVSQHRASTKWGGGGGRGVFERSAMRSMWGPQ